LSIALLEIINKLGIDTLYIPHRGDIHKDHRVTFEAALVAARPINNCPVNTIYAYETVSETEWAAPFGDDVFIPTVFEDITPYIEKKKKAFTYFTAQERKFPHPRSLQNLEYLSKLRGATVGFNNAEAFMLVRSLIK
jgi:LmbE family N-acetylglucosaminyl deacetylase